VTQRHAIPRLNELTREQLPLLPWKLLRDLIEQVNARILHDFLVKGAIAGAVVVEGVFPAAGELARLAFAILDVLAEVDGLFGGDVETD